MDEPIIPESAPEGKPDLATARATFCEAQEDVWRLEAATHAAWLQYIDSGQAAGAHNTFSQADWALQVAQGVLSQVRAAYRLAVLRAESEAV